MLPYHKPLVFARCATTRTRAKPGQPYNCSRLTLQAQLKSKACFLPGPAVLAAGGPDEPSRGVGSHHDPHRYHPHLILITTIATNSERQRSQAELGFRTAAFRVFKGFATTISCWSSGFDKHHLFSGRRAGFGNQHLTCVGVRLLNQHLLLGYLGFATTISVLVLSLATNISSWVVPLPGACQLSSPCSFRFVGFAITISLFLGFWVWVFDFPTNTPFTV